TRRAIARIAKEGRKYGISLCVVSQRPGELDSTILSQCNTIFALRLANAQDQKIVSSAVSDTTGSLLEFLPALGEREVIAFGDGVSLPMRFRFNKLPAHALPKGGTAKFSDQWRGHAEDKSFVEAVVNRWRGGSSEDPEPGQPSGMQPASGQIRDIAEIASDELPAAAVPGSGSTRCSADGDASQPVAHGGESASLAALANKVAQRVSEQTGAATQPPPSTHSAQSQYRQGAPAGQSSPTPPEPQGTGQSSDNASILPRISR
ncbi:MAG: hypothetical protein K8F25_16510, partial [Fimbriimonadaceae bacterium]|nr:hypothetical protein [Alphaproteobacteria bacterium]